MGPKYTIPTPKFKEKNCILIAVEMESSVQGISYQDILSIILIVILNDIEKTIKSTARANMIPPESGAAIESSVPCCLKLSYMGHQGFCQKDEFPDNFFGPLPSVLIP